jgi:iron(III) transport system substrate-binding protein
MNRMHLISVVLMISVLGLLATACGSEPTVTPRPTPTAAPLVEAAPTPTLRPGVPTPTPFPTPTLRPGQTPVLGPTPTSPPGLGPTATPAPTPTVDASFPAEWDRLIAAAQEEGEVVIIAGGSASTDMRHHLNFFREKFGIKVVVGRGSGTDQANRLLAERGNGRYTADIAHIGPTSGNVRLVPNGAYDPIKPLLIHPEVVDESLWLNNKHHYLDVDQDKIFAWNGVAGVTRFPSWYNTEEVADADLPRNADDILNGRWKSVLAMQPPVTGGAGGSYFTLYVHPDFGPEFVERFIRETDIFFTTDALSMLNGLVNGKFHGIYGGTGAQDPEELEDKGLPIAQPPYDVTSVKTIAPTGSANNVAVLNRRPNPNAAQLYVNWLLSREGQTVWMDDPEEDQNPSLRTDDIPFGTTDPDERRKPGVTYLIIVAEPEILAKRDEALQFASDLYYEVTQ